MTYQDREKILSKDALSLDDLGSLLGCSKSTACEIMQQIKRKMGDTLGIKGRLLTNTYLKFVGAEAFPDRYNGEEK